MTNINPPANANPLHNKNTGVSLPASEATALAATNTIVFQNTGNTVLRVAITTPGTGTILGLVPANNVAITLAAGDNLIGPLDPAIFGTTVSITTASAIGSVGCYSMATRFANATHNPFETSSTASDA